MTEDKQREITPEEAKYQAIKGTIERSGKKLRDFNDAELMAFFGANQDIIKRLKTEEQTAIIQGSFLKIKSILKKYIDTAEENYDLITIWIIGTYVHSAFSSYPYLFFNAMKGSGKSRTIKLIVCIAYNGRLVMDLTDAVLFRTAKGSTLGIDEFENVAAKERITLRTLLNAAYKKGVKVPRISKQKSKDGEKMVLEEFEIYAPIVMANINGLDDVLSDRCITIIQERSTNERINRLIEDFEDNAEINAVKEQLSVQLVKLVQLVQSKNIISDWNKYVALKCSPETTQTALNAQITPEKLEIFDKIYASDVKARHLELFFPLFIMASLMGDKFLDRTIDTAKRIVANKKNDDLTENRDVALIEFVSSQPQGLDFIPISELTRKFKEYMQEEDEQYHTISSKWLGRALKRLKLTIDRRRVGKGVEVILNIANAQEKIKIFKTNNTTDKEIKNGE
ncbi:MAG: hypothetical protein PHW73_12660 [Atribacterota bacterium]|nr:hypothetical protein [Atribacterota bacterium]